MSKYQYNQKELNNDFGLLWSDYGARWLDLQRGVWGQIDPLAEKYYAWSGYNYVGDNPVMNIDPDGRVIQPANEDSKKYYDELYSNASKETQAIYDKLNTSEVVYNINVSENLPEKGGGTMYNFETNQLDINVSPEGEYTVGLLADELTHANQFENGEIGYIQGTEGQRGIVSYDLEDEVASKYAAIDALATKGLKMNDSEIANKYPNSAAFQDMYGTNGEKPSDKNINKWAKKSGYHKELNGKLTMGGSTKPDVKQLERSKKDGDIKDFKINKPK